MALARSLATGAAAAALCALLGLPATARQLSVSVTPGGLQQASPPKGSAFVLGQVVDGTSGKPVGGAVVTLNISSAPTQPPGRGIPARGSQPAGAPPPGQTLNNSARVLADGEGRFLFHGLPAGRVTLSATAPGYSAGSYGARRPGGASLPLVLTDGQHVADATIRLWKVASVSGTVVDEAGEPLVGVTVTFLRFQNVNGVRRTSGGPNVTTDDRGAFHFSTSPGDFLLVVPATSTSTPASSLDMFQRAMSTPGQSDDMFRTLSSSGAPIPSGGGFRVGDMQYQPPGGLGRNIPPIPPDGRLQVYQTTYYPATLTPSQAQVISLSPGDERADLDLTLRLSQTARVMGTISGPDGTGGNLGVRLVVADSRDSTFNSNYPAASTLSEPSGAFTFLGVPAGQYDLQVTRIPRPQIINGQPPTGAASSVPTLWARVPVSVGPTDVAGVNVALRLGVRISGRVEFDGSAPRPTADRFSQGNVLLTDLDDQGQQVQGTRVSADGQFTTQGVLPGRYLVSIGANWGNGWTLKSIVANNRDLSASPQVIDSDITNAVATFTDHPNHIDGTVQLPQLAADGPWMVVFFPANFQAWLANGTAGRTSRLVRLDDSGHFTLAGIPAGDYVFAAIPADLSNGWQDPKTVEAIARGATRLQIGDDDRRTIDLKVLTIR